MSSRSKYPVTIWYHLTLPSTIGSDSPHHELSGEQWASLLRIPKRQDGWRNTRWAVHIEDPKKAWLVFEWRTTEKLESFKRSEIYNSFWKRLVALLEAPPMVYHIYPGKGSNLGRGFVAPKFPYPESRDELLTLFFPADITASAKSEVESSCGIQSFTTVFRQQLSQDWTGDQLLLGTNRGWVEEEMIWEGKAVKAYLFLFRWCSPNAERVFKEEEKWDRNDQKNVEPSLAMDCFFEEMKEIGMVGFESAHGEFIQL